ncbi:Photosystem I reaction center subunit III, chloroplastic [Fagus crenata]
MALTIPTNLSKPILKPKFSSPSSPKPRPMILNCSSSSSSASQTNKQDEKTSSPLQAFSAALALSSILVSAPLPAMADIAGLTPCKDSKQFAKREKQQIKKLESSLKLYAPDSAPALAINATIEKTKRRFDNYGKQGLLCGSDGLPHLIVSGDQRHWEGLSGLLLLTERSSLVILLSRTSRFIISQWHGMKRRRRGRWSACLRNLFEERSGGIFLVFNL